MLQTVLLVLHVVVAIALIAFILLQQGRGATTGAAFGSGASSTVFGARGSASFLSRTTSVLAIVFFSNCLVLAFLGGQRSAPDSVLDHLSSDPVPAPTSAPLDGPPAGNATGATAPADVPVPAAPATTTATAPAADKAADLPSIPPTQTSP